MRSNAMLAGVLSLCLAAGAYAVAPPAPGVETPAGFTEYFTSLNAAYASNLRAPEITASGTVLAGAAPRSVRLPVILAAYSDLPQSTTRDNFTQRLFGGFATGTMAEYYAEVSRGRFALSGKVYGWVTLPGSLASYTRGGSLGDETLFPDSPRGLVAHAVAAADSQVDFGLYDNDGPDGVPNSGDDDGRVDALIVVHTGGDAAAGASANLWSHTGRLGPDSVITSDPAAGGGFIRVDLYSLLPELAGNGSLPVASEIGVYCHEFGHQLGLVDLYPAGYNQGQGVVSNGIGVWGLMAFGTQGGNGATPSRPTHLCAWSKLRLGWVDAAFGDLSGPLALDPVQSGGKVVQVWDNDYRDLSYFLLEYRTRTGFDSGLPGEGLLVSHVDGRAFDNDDPAFKLVDPEEADGLGQLDSGLSLGDAGDPYPGSSGNTMFSAASNPSSARNDGSASGVALSGIRIENGRALFSLAQPSRSMVTIAYDEDGPDPDRGFGYDNNLAHGAVVFTAPVSGIIESVGTAFIYPGMSYGLTVLGGHRGGLMDCPVAVQSGESPGEGWQSIVLERSVYLAAGDSVIIDFAWQTGEFDHGWPLPFDRTGQRSGRSWVSLYGLGSYEAFDYDISLRAHLRPAAGPGTAINLVREVALASPRLDFGRAFSGEQYVRALEILNTGLRPVDLSPPSVSGENFSLEAYPSRTECGADSLIYVRFTPAGKGKATGGLTLSTPSGSLEAELTAEVAGWSLRYDSTATPAGLAAFTDAAHGAARFDPGRRVLLAGVRTYCLRDSMRLRLRVWARAAHGGGDCLVAEMDSDTLLVSRGWHQIFLPKPVDVDSGDTFIADIRYATPGTAFNELVPIDTLRPVRTVSYYNIREQESWIAARSPVAIRALLLEPDAYSGEVVFKRPRLDLSARELALDAAVGVQTDGEIWLFNRGSADLRATVSVAADGDSCRFVLGDSTYTVTCGDSSRLTFSCTAEAPGVHTGVLEVRYGDEVVNVQLTVLAGSFELGHDENGHTAAAGFMDTVAVGAVRLDSPWPGTLSRARFYVNQAPARVRVSVFAALGDSLVPADSLSGADSLFQKSGWHELALEPALVMAAGNTFVLAAAFTSPGNYPLPIDHLGIPSSQSLAAGSLDGPWEVLNYDLNLRAVVEAAVGEMYPVSGRVATAEGSPLAGVRLLLIAGDALYRAESDSEGEFSFHSVPAGSYSFSALREGYSISHARSLNVSGATGNLSLVARPARSGDVDGSGSVNIFDLLALLREISGKSELSGRGDLDGNGRVDIFDLLELLRLLK